MGRLTITTPTGAALKLNNPQNEKEASRQLMAAYKIAINKLAAYEDTGLIPEEVAELQKEVILLVQESVKREKTLAKLEAEVKVWAKAEEQGLLLILPCAIGDTLYFTDRYHGEIYKEATVDGIGIHWTNNKDIGDFIPLSIIGENVFLSIEEAKAALAAEKGESR